MGYRNGDLHWTLMQNHVELEPVKT